MSAVTLPDVKQQKDKVLEAWLIYKLSNHALEFWLQIFVWEGLLCLSDPLTGRGLSSHAWKVRSRHYHYLTEEEGETREKLGVFQGLQASGRRCWQQISLAEAVRCLTQLPGQSSLQTLPHILTFSRFPLKNPQETPKSCHLTFAHTSPFAWKSLHLPLGDLLFFENHSNTISSIKPSFTGHLPPHVPMW